MKRLTEAKIHQIVGDSIRKTLRESTTSIKDSYYTLVNAINEFENAFQNEYDTTDESNAEIITALENAREKIDELVRHPEGSGGTKIWNNIGF